jgi:hypothetical protein
VSVTLYASTFEHEMWNGPKRYIAIVVYDTLELFRDACRNHDHRNMQKPDEEWKEAYGAFFPATTFDGERWVIPQNKQVISTIVS